MSDEQQRREDAWAVMKQMHDDLSKPAELRAAGGWCAPSSVAYGPAWQVGQYGTELVIPLIQTTRGGIRFP